MKIDYIRKLTTSHMVLEAAGEAVPWEEKMIAYGRGQRVLFAEHVRENGTEQLWYDITGKQSLDMLLESEELGFELLCRILTGLYEAVESLESFLLRADALLLLPECIFVDYRTGEVYFCYYPGNPDSRTDAFVLLLEFLLARLNHQDARAVELAYKVYEQAVLVKGEGSLGEWKRLLRIPYEKENTEKEDTPGEMGNIESAESIESTESIESAECLEGIENNKGNKGNKSNKSIKHVEDTGRYFSGDIVSASMEKIACLPVRGLWKRLSERLGLHRILRGEEKETFVFEPEEEDERPTPRPTVLLSELVLPPEGILRYEGESGNQDLVISGESYLIGSGQECDGIIGSGTVSRKHARITRKGDVYFVEDMNSSNGTYVGGKLLNYRTKISLQKNEVVVFADEKFRFI